MKHCSSVLSDRSQMFFKISFNVRGAKLDLWWFDSRERSLRCIVQVHGILEATSPIQIPHGFVVRFWHDSWHLLGLRVSVVKYIRSVVKACGGVKHLGNDHDLHVVQLGVNNMSIHLNERRHLDGAIEADVGNVLQLWAKMADM